jgi:hypothetical protein
MRQTFIKLTASALCLLAFTQTKAQVTTSFGPEVGFAASGLYDDDADVQAGIHGHVGGTAHFQFGRFFAIRPSVLLRVGNFEDADFSDEKISLTRISVPIPLLFSYNFNNNGKIFVGAGPNLMYSIAGKYKTNGESEKLKFGSGEDADMKPLDLGLHIKGGYQFGNGIALSMFFNAGLSNLNPHSSTYKLKTLDVLGFSFGWMFGGKSDY